MELLIQVRPACLFLFVQRHPRHWYKPWPVVPRSKLFVAGFAFLACSSLLILIVGQNSFGTFLVPHQAPGKFCMSCMPCIGLRRLGHCARNPPTQSCYLLAIVQFQGDLISCQGQVPKGKVDLGLPWYRNPYPDVNTLLPSFSGTVQISSPP